MYHADGMWTVCVCDECVSALFLCDCWQLHSGAMLMNSDIIAHLTAAWPANGFMYLCLHDFLINSNSSPLLSSSFFSSILY